MDDAPQFPYQLCVYAVCIPLLALIPCRRRLGGCPRCCKREQIPSQYHCFRRSHGQVKFSLAPARKQLHKFVLCKVVNVLT